MLKNRIEMVLAKRRSGMELVQVGILIAIAIAVGLIFRTQITNFINNVFKNLNADNFS